MKRVTMILAAVVVAGVGSMIPRPLGAQSGSAPASASRIAVCSLVPKDEVKRHLPWLPMLDQFPIEEEPIGASGSSCNYPSVTVQVLPFSPRTIEAMRERGGLETVAGVGDEAYFYNNRNGYAEVYVRIGNRLLTVQANANDNVQGVKPGAISLAKVLVEKLR
jgi:hypothetical protein